MTCKKDRLSLITSMMDPATKRKQKESPCITEPCQSWRKVTHNIRAVKTFLSSRRLWNSQQRHKFLRAEASRYILIFRLTEMTFPGVFKNYFSTADAMLFGHNTRRTGNNAVEMSQAFHDIAQFERFTDLYAVNVIQNWETDALQFHLMVLIFCKQLW